MLHGQGVFAVASISPRTFVGEYIGEVCLTRPRDCRFVLRVTVDDVMGQYHFIDARDPSKSNWTRFVNDPGPGQTPNCEFRRSDLRVEVWSVRTISPGEELTIQYLDWSTHVGRSRASARTRQRAQRLPSSSGSDANPVVRRTPRISRRTTSPRLSPAASTTSKLRKMADELAVAKQALLDMQQSQSRQQNLQQQPQGVRQQQTPRRPQRQPQIVPQIQHQDSFAESASDPCAATGGAAAER